jgi:predicted integral membrane protein DUF2269
MRTLMATAFAEPGKVTFYNVVLFVHVAAAVVAFGATFIYPVFFAFGKRVDARHLPFFHRVQGRFGARVITGGGTLILLAGVYMAIKGPYDFGDAFVGIGLFVILLLLGLGGAFFAPRERRLLELSERDVAASGGGPVSLSEEYLAVSRQVERVIWMSQSLVLIAIFLMVTKLGV